MDNHNADVISCVTSCGFYHHTGKLFGVVGFEQITFKFKILNPWLHWSQEFVCFIDVETWGRKNVQELTLVVLSGQETFPCIFLHIRSVLKDGQIFYVRFSTGLKKYRVVCPKNVKISEKIKSDSSGISSKLECVWHLISTKN